MFPPPAVPVLTTHSIASLPSLQSGAGFFYHLLHALTGFFSRALLRSSARSACASLRSSIAYYSPAHSCPVTSQFRGTRGLVLRYCFRGLPCPPLNVCSIFGGGAALGAGAYRRSRNIRLFNTHLDALGTFATFQHASVRSKSKTRAFLFISTTGARSYIRSDILNIGTVNTVATRQFSTTFLYVKPFREKVGSDVLHGFSYIYCGFFVRFYFRAFLN